LKAAALFLILSLQAYKFMLHLMIELGADLSVLSCWYKTDKM